MARFVAAAAMFAAMFTLFPAFAQQSRINVDRFAIGCAERLRDKLSSLVLETPDICTYERGSETARMALLTNGGRGAALTTSDLTSMIILHPLSDFKLMRAGTYPDRYDVIYLDKDEKPLTSWLISYFVALKNDTIWVRCLRSHGTCAFYLPVCEIDTGKQRLTAVLAGYYKGLEEGEAYVAAVASLRDSLSKSARCILNRP